MTALSVSCSSPARRASSSASRASSIAVVAAPDRDGRSSQKTKATTCPKEKVSTSAGSLPWTATHIAVAATRAALPATASAVRWRSRRSSTRNIEAPRAARLTSAARTGPRLACLSRGPLHSRTTRVPPRRGTRRGTPCPDRLHPGHDGVADPVAQPGWPVRVEATPVSVIVTRTAPPSKTSATRRWAGLPGSEASEPAWRRTLLSASWPASIASPRRRAAVPWGRAGGRTHGSREPHLQWTA